MTCPVVHLIIFELTLLVGQVNDAALAGESTLVSCSSDTTVKVCEFVTIACSCSNILPFNIFFWYHHIGFLIRLIFSVTTRHGTAYQMEPVRGLSVSTRTMLLVWQLRQKMYLDYMLFFCMIC